MAKRKSAKAKDPIVGSAMERALVKRLDEAAKRQDSTRSRVVRLAVRDYLDRLETETTR